MDEVVDIFLEDSQNRGAGGASGHFYKNGALHKNTEHFHVHIAVNRMSEKTGKMVQPHRGFDRHMRHDAAHICCARPLTQGHKQGWQSEKHSRYVVLENGELAKRRDAKKAVKPSGLYSVGAADFEHVPFL